VSPSSACGGADADGERDRGEHAGTPGDPRTPEAVTPGRSDASAGQTDHAAARRLLDSVPDFDGHERPPCRLAQIAWPYLAPDKRMRRWTETIRVFDLEISQRDITIDFTLPSAEIDGHWLLPSAYLGKSPVAPDLEVRDAAGAAISVPTKSENMAITAAALDGLEGAGLISYAAHPKLRNLVRQVIFAAEFEARIARLLIAEMLGPGEELLSSLLAGLEDRFLLWVPVSGSPGCDQQITIHRRQGLNRNPILTATRVYKERTVQTPLGPILTSLREATGPRRLSPSAVGGRILRLFGLTPFEYEHETTEAHRFASFHLRVMAPRGLVVRDVGVRAAVAESIPAQPPRSLAEVRRSEPGFTYQGREAELAHFHCAREENPSVLVAFTTLGIRGGLTSLWAGAVVFTALLLWAIHRLAPANLPSSDSVQLEATVAILLIGPALASAWAIRADPGDLLERTLTGARALLLASALLSVATALSLAGFRPFRWSNETAVEVYAALSYGVGALIVVGWAVTLSSCWFLYREILTSARRNHVTLFLLSALAAAVCVHGELPVRLVGLTLLATGLAMAAVFAHPGHATRSADAGPAAAGLGAVLTLLGGGWFLGFYENVATRHALQIGVIVTEGLLMVIAAVQWYRSP
jgi:hypothetical protein